jgi:AraC-like DNA-binding protein
VFGDDAVLAQVTRNMVSQLEEPGPPSSLALDELQLVLGAHLLRRYSGLQQPRADRVVALATWQRWRVQELLSEQRGGNIRLGELARECELPIGYFARAFQASFGTTCQQWLTRERMEHAKGLLARPLASVSEVAIQTGFGDPGRFARAFRSVVGVAPGAWHRQHGRTVH